MGKVKHLDKIRKFFVESPVVDIGSLKRFLGRKQKGDYIYAVINNLIKKNEIKIITRGFYTTRDDPTLAVFCFKPSYLGLQDAMSTHNVWEQETIPVVITTRKVRTGLRKVMGMNVLIRRIDKKYFFGFDYYKSGDFYFPYSDVEKTFIDMVYFRANLDKEVVKEFVKKIDKKKLKGYLRKYPVKFREKVSNYI